MQPTVVLSLSAYAGFLSIQPINYALHGAVESIFFLMGTQATQAHHHRQFFRRSHAEAHAATVDEQQA